MCAESDSYPSSTQSFKINSLQHFACLEKAADMFPCAALYMRISDTFRSRDITTQSSWTVGNADQLFMRIYGVCRNPITQAGKGQSVGILIEEGSGAVYIKRNRISGHILGPIDYRADSSIVIGWEQLLSVCHDGEEMRVYFRNKASWVQNSALRSFREAKCHFGKS